MIRETSAGRNLQKKLGTGILLKTHPIKTLNPNAKNKKN
jgi:hypothetical protein